MIAEASLHVAWPLESKVCGCLDLASGGMQTRCGALAMSPCVAACVGFQADRSDRRQSAQWWAR